MNTFWAIIFGGLLVITLPVTFPVVCIFVYGSAIIILTLTVAGYYLMNLYPEICIGVMTILFAIGYLIHRRMRAE